MPLVVRDHPLTDSNDQLSYLVFKVFLLVPFLWEFKSVLDWTVTTAPAIRTMAMLAMAALTMAVLWHASPLYIP